MKRKETLILNVSLHETLVRLLVMIWIPWSISLCAYSPWVLVITFYLLVTALGGFCPLKWVGKRFLSPLGDLQLLRAMLQKKHPHLPFL